MLERLGASRKMADLGRLGGLQGGVARAKALGPRRRVAIAGQAAVARWSKPALVIDREPRDRGELLAVVAHYGSRVSRVGSALDLEAVVVRAIDESRSDPSLARMLPVFLWRIREQLDTKKLVRLARKPQTAAALGYFLELTAKLGGSQKELGAAIASLRSRKMQSLVYFFHAAERNPFEAMAADERTPREARRWGLLTGTPTDSFATYFRKVRNL